MASGGRVGFETVAWFNGSLFNDDTTRSGSPTRTRRGMLLLRPRTAGQPTLPRMTLFAGCWTSTAAAAEWSSQCGSRAGWSTTAGEELDVDDAPDAPRPLDPHAQREP